MYYLLSRLYCLLALLGFGVAYLKVYPMNSSTLLDKKLTIKSNVFPVACIGTYKLAEDQLVPCLQKGFAVIDSAKAYDNEVLIGKALSFLGLTSEVKVITKLNKANLVDKHTLRRAVLESATNLGKVPEFVLIHGPYPDIPMVSLICELDTMKQEGLLKEWGVSNFEVDHLAILIEEGLIPALNQVEYHPFFQRPALLSYCKKHGIILQAYRPLMEGNVLVHPVLKAIATSHNISPAMVVYTWLAQQSIAIVTKVSCDEHRDEYATSGHFVVSEQEMMAIASLNLPEQKGRTCMRSDWFVPFSQVVANVWKQID